MTLAFLSGIGSGELILIVAVALIVLGPKRFPEIARKIGGVVRDLRRATYDLQRQIDDELRDVEVEVRDVVPRKGAWQAPAALPTAKGEPVEVSAAPPNRATYGVAAEEAAPTPAYVPPADRPPAAEAAPVRDTAADAEPGPTEPDRQLPKIVAQRDDSGVWVAGGARAGTPRPGPLTGDAAPAPAPDDPGAQT